MNKNQWPDASVKRHVISQFCFFVFFWLINCYTLLEEAIYQKSDKGSKVELSSRLKDDLPKK